jgi:NTE family protein
VRAGGAALEAPRGLVQAYSGDFEMTETIHDLVEPARRLPADLEHEPSAGSAVCLSGGGYRAMLFHTGVLWRLCETRWLHKVDRVSSVSGGSLTAAVLAMAWGDVMAAANPRSAFSDRVVRPLRDARGHDLRPNIRICR